MLQPEERLDKILANAGYGTRRDVKRLLHAGAVTVNGTVVTDCASHIHTDRDCLAVDGETVRIRSNICLMLNKSRNVVCTARDGEHETVFDLLDDEYRAGSCGRDLHAVGRLDIDTEGLLLLTTDGALTHRLISPRTHVGKTYLACLRDEVSDARRAEYVQRFAAGIHIMPEDNEPEADCKSAVLEWTDPVLLPSRTPAAASALLTIYEGKYHQVKRMFSAVGNEVVYLKRLSIGKLKLDASLEPGEYRELTSDELLLLADATPNG